MSANGRGRRRGRARIVGALDIGSSKIACFIGEAGGAGTAAGEGIRVLGAGVHRSQGVKAGVITDPHATEAAVRAAVAQAERASGISLDDVYVSIACGRLKSLSFAAHADIGSGRVRDADIARIMEGATGYAERDGRMLVHMNRRGYRLDGAPGGDNPRGLACGRLTADMHAVTADEGAVRNLMLVVERSDLTVAGLVAAPVASALAVTSEEQRQLGVTVVDMGAGTTTVAVFADGTLAQCEVMLAGGHHLSFEIAQNLHVPLAEAERIKTLYASMVNAPSDFNDSFSYAGVGDGGEAASRETRAQLTAVVRPRVDSQLEALAERLAASGFDRGPLVITGGASQLAGLDGYAGAVLGRDVRVGGPPEWLLPHGAAGGFAMAAAAGLLVAGSGGETLESERASGGRFGYLGLVGRWVRDGL